jgi:hypothetical protein
VWSLGPPLKGTIKVILDDNSYNNTRRLGFGGVLRDNDDNWLLGFFAFIRIST